MHSLPTKVRCYICCLLALLLWLAGQAHAALTIDNEADMLKAFPNAEQVGANINYVVTLDGAKVFMMFDNHKSPYALVLMIVHSANKKNVMSAAKRLRTMLPERHKELPYVGKGYGAVFVTHWISSVTLSYSEPLGVIFSSSSHSCENLNVKAMGWKDGLLTVRCSVPGTGTGEAELALDPLVAPVRLILLRKIRSRVPIDFYDFLSFPRRMPPPYSSGTSASNLAAGKSYLRTKTVLYYYSGMYCIASNSAKKIYYAGIPSAVREALTDGYAVEPITYPAKNHPWPSNDTTDSDSDDQPDKTPDKAPDTTPENPTEKQQDTPTPAPQPATPRREPLPGLPADLLNVTPEEALRKYLQTLRQM